MPKKPPLIHIRYAIPDDVPKILHIEHECFADPMEERDIARILGSSRMWLRVALLHGTNLAGHVVYLQGRKRPVRIIDRVAVHPEARRLGIGRKLVNDALMCSRSRLQKSIEAALPDEALPEAHALFKACGFRFCLPKRGFTKVFLPLLPVPKPAKVGDVS
jgi:GNAT superfamily N-acetyltransferase